MYIISHIQLCHPESQHTCTICSKIKSKTFRKSKSKNAPFCSRTVSILTQLRTNMSPLRTSGVLLPITAWLEWKKACLLCQGLLNQDDLNPLGPHSRPLRGDWKVMNGRFLGGVMMRQKLRQCVLFQMPTDDMRRRGSRSQTHLDVVGGKSSLRHLEAKRCPILTGSCVNKSVFYSFEPLQQERKFKKPTMI